MLDALGAHLSNAQIAGRLHISVRTVESHVASPRKLGAAQEGLPYSCRHGASWKRMPSVYRAPDRTTETPCRTGAAVKPRTERIGRSRVVNTSPLPWGSAITVPRD